jgi:hypothetical protein
MPDLHMNFFTPSDLLRLEQSTALLIRAIRQSMTGSESGESRLEIDFRTTAKNVDVVKGARWHIIPSHGCRDVLPCFSEFYESDIIQVPSNVAWRDYYELLFLKVCNGLAGTLVLEMSSSGRARVTLHKSA